MGHARRDVGTTIHGLLRRWTRGGGDGGLGGATAANELYVVYAAIPEPSTLVLAGLGLAGLAWRLRRRRAA